MADRKAAWTGLQVAATAHAGAPRDAVTAAALSEAAKAWAVASGYRPPVEASSGDAPTFGFGSGKGKTPAEVDSKSLRWWNANSPQWMSRSRLERYYRTPYRKARRLQ